MALPLRFQLRQWVRKARPFEQLPRAVKRRRAQIYFSGTQLLFELHVSAAASRIDSNAVLRGGNADYHTGLI